MEGKINQFHDFFLIVCTFEFFFFFRFCYEVAELSWWERKMAATLFADPPDATMEEAKDHFMAAEELKPDGWKENRQFLAKSYIQLKDFPAALHWLDQANDLPVNNPDVSFSFPQKNIKKSGKDSHSAEKRKIYPQLTRKYFVKTTR